MKTVFKIFGFLLLLVVVVVAGSIFYIDKVVKVAVEQVGPEVTGTPVELSDVSLSLLDGNGSLQGLSIGNPEGFSSPTVFQLDDISISLDKESLLSDVVIIHSIDIVAPKVTYETGSNGSNIAALQENIERLTGSGSAESTSTESTRKVIIERLSVTQGNIEVVHPLLGDKPMAVGLPDIVMTDIGAKSNGATVAEVAEQLLEALSENATVAVLRDSALDKLGIDLEELEESKNMINEAKDKIEGLLDGFR